jgi:hypothetical protein
MKTIKKIKSTSRTKKISGTKTEQPIRIFSYNISWESMTGKKPHWELCTNNTDKKHPKHFSVCVGNIAQVIEENDTDFVCLQEATDFYKLINNSPRLKSMKFKEHNSGLDDMVTFWKPEYKLLYTIVGEFEKGRPWLATVFKDGLCLINVHFGHYSDSDELALLDLMVKTVEKGMQKMRTVVKRVIISGDFNFNIKDFGTKEFDNKKNEIKINNRIFYHNPKHILTCCIRRRRHYDHVIDSFGVPKDIYIPDVHYMSSDHKPIVAVLSC